LPQCELICEWIRVKLCGLRCVEVCGPPDPDAEFPALPAFARALVRLAANEALLRRVVDAVACGDAEGYRAAIAELELERFCHLICRYVCSTIYRRICEVVCAPAPGAADPVLEIRADAEALARLLDNESVIGAMVKAAETLDCIPLQTAIDEAGFSGNCEVICFIFCVWRCVWVCRFFCEGPPPIFAGPEAIEEARAFALAARPLAGHPRALAGLVAAIADRNAETFRTIVAQFRLGPYCWQVCGWVCSEVCSEFCICVCPQLFPWFTSIGGYDYLAQVDSALPATGLTNGDTRAFFETMRLNGVLTQTLGGQPMEYRFEFQPIAVASTTLTGSITSAQTSISVASSAGFPSAPFNAVIGGAAGGYEIVTVTSGPPGTAWTVVRHQKSTAALAAADGATIVTGAAASGGWTPVPETWIAPTYIGLREAGLPPFPEYWVNPPSPPPPPPAVIPVNIVGGWIQVPQGANVFLNGNMINLISSALPSFPAADETGVTAGNPANHPLTLDHCFGLRMRVRQQGKPATETDGGTCAVVAIDNTLYNNIDHHPDWDGGVTSNQFAVAMVDIKELQGNGCADLTNSLTVLFTASHPNLGAVGVQMIGPGGPYPFTLPTPIPETGDWYGVATPNGWSLANLKPCAYIVQLAVDLLLTTGDQDFGPPLIDQIAFCLTGP
ncbi:MAG: hypothetical protein JO288_22640, partial [Hyphomicrobiales bacterium]|nr:hypothetical protein [Hyphomicrobiales bacterium]